MSETLTFSGLEQKKTPQLEEIYIEGTPFYKMSGSDVIDPFFMSIVSSSDHWLFLSSNGGLTAGRKNSNQALFPYETDDKITRHNSYTGPITVIKVRRGSQWHLWEPFKDNLQEKVPISRNLYKSRYGDSVILEEIHHELELSFSYQWCTSHQFGFVRKCRLSNLGSNTMEMELLDGVQNVLPFGVGEQLQSRASNLSDAYKRSELEKSSGLGIFALSAMIVDKAEPSESLFANVCYNLGMPDAVHLLSSRQIQKFYSHQTIENEYDVKAQKGAYISVEEIVLSPEGEKEWYLVADVKKNQSEVRELIEACHQESVLIEAINKDIKRGTEKLIALIASSDGLQHTNDSRRDSRHVSNVLFNIFRGGVPIDNYVIQKDDFLAYLKTANAEVWANEKDRFQAFPERGTLFELVQLVDQGSNPDLYRLTKEYLPLTYSRRHGDPSRPWNQFSINTRNEKDGSIFFDYEGNWRDIFQNWEALAHSFPAYIEGMIFKFLNASTFDGYNPYRVMKGGIDWEVIEEDDPWSYIGYWGDHQIIYLLKFLEFINDHQPGKLESWLGEEVFVYAQVPYEIKAYEEILKDPKDTISFNHEQDAYLRDRMERLGADGVLHLKEDGHVYHVNLLEKLLATVLAKLSNLVPDAGIWMNTQRPEWNDANNALVGNGASMVTLYYLRRFMKFFERLIEAASQDEFRISSELVDFYKGIRKVLKTYTPIPENGFTTEQRRDILDQLGRVASDYRSHIYHSGFWGKKRSISKEGLQEFTAASIEFFEHSIEQNERPDHLYHAYNLISTEDQGVVISYLTEMLEGQVAVLSSGYLEPKEALKVLDALKASALFRPDQYSYLLYPNKELPGFLNKNIIQEQQASRSLLIQKMLDAGDTSIVQKDNTGEIHFNANFQNVNYLEAALDELEDSPYGSLASKERELLLDLYEEVFNHKEFTGRSGTFFGYEGLGSIYWHMVSKLLLAVQENALKAIREGEDPKTVGKILEHYYEIQAGIGVHKSPQLYGAFPTDPYSHTPFGKGAQQPGMTGQVKEDILCRFGELGVFVEQGRLRFYPCLLRKREEFLEEDEIFRYVDIDGSVKELPLKQGQLAFTYCQVPVIYQVGDEERMVIQYSDGDKEEASTLILSMDTSKKVFQRTGDVACLYVTVSQSYLK